MSNVINCNGFIELPFSSYLVVDHQIDCVTDAQFEYLATITANIQNLSLCERAVIVPFPDGIEVTNPCDPQGPKIIVYEIEVRQLYVSGAINYIVGANVVKLDQSIINPTTIPPIVTCNTLNPANTLNYATVIGSSYLNNEPLFILNTQPDDTPEYCVHVEVEDLEVAFGGFTPAPDADYIYTIRGKFVISPQSNI